MNHPLLRDAALLLLRVVAGVIFIAHGWQRVFITGMSGPDGTVETFAAASVPAPGTAAWIVAVVEMLGGALLIVGLLATAAAGVLAVVELVVGYYLHWSHGFFAHDGGVELPLILLSVCLCVLVFGSGRASLDRVLTRFV